MKPRTAEIRRFARAALTCTGQLTRGGEWVYDPDTGERIVNRTVVYEGPCLVYAMESSKIVEIHGWRPTVSKYAIILPAGTDVAIKDRFTATHSPVAPELEGIELGILDTPLNAWQVAITCIGERIQ